MADSRSPRSRIVVDSSPRHRRRTAQSYPASPNSEIWVAISVIIAAALATFLALFITSRPYDPATASLAPQQTVPSGAMFTPSPKPSASPSPTASPKESPAASPPAPAGEKPNSPIDDAAIQSHIDAALSGDPVLSKLDVSTLVENSKVTIVGSVGSAELKQRVERVVRSIKGVTLVENQLVVNENTP